MFALFPNIWAFSYDFYYLWAAGHLAAMGQNPYDPLLLRKELLALGWPVNEQVQGLTHLPYMFWLYRMFAVLPFEVARFVWAGVVTILYFSVIWLLNSSSMFSPLAERKYVLRPMLFALFVFPPLWADIAFGQVNILALLGLLAAISRIKTVNPLMAGALFSLTAVKPHLFLPVYAALLVLSLRRRDFAFLGAAAAGLGAQMLLTWILVPNVFVEYFSQFSSITNHAAELAGASISQVAAVTFDLPWLRFAFLGIAIAFGFGLGLQRKEIDTTLVRILVPLSLVTAPYVWMHSFVILIPSYLLLVLPRLEKVGTAGRVLFGVTCALCIGTIFRTDFAPWWCLLPILILTLGMRNAANNDQDK